MKNRGKTPPRIAKWMLSRLSFYENNFALSNAIDDEYFEIRLSSGFFESVTRLINSVKTHNHDHTCGASDQRCAHHGV